RQRYGNYFDFFWRAKRPSDVTVRLEYRQEKLHEHVQAQEITYRNVRGTHKTEFKVIGDDYFDDGRVIAWRCLLVANGQIVAENRSLMWEYRAASGVGRFRSRLEPAKEDPRLTRPLVDCVWNQNS